MPYGSTCADDRRSATSTATVSADFRDNGFRLRNYPGHQPGEIDTAVTILEMRTLYDNAIIT